MHTRSISISKQVFIILIVKLSTGSAIAQLSLCRKVIPLQMSMRNDYVDAKVT